MSEYFGDENVPEERFNKYCKLCREKQIHTFEEHGAAIIYGVENRKAALREEVRIKERLEKASRG